MENASKALIIAGAILIAIVLIGVGVLLISNSQGIFNQGSTQLSSMEIQAFNSPFLAYEGKQTGSSVKELLRKISAQNTVDDEHPINVEIGSSDKYEPLDTSNLNDAIGKISASKRYQVTPDYDSTGSGLITVIKIEAST